MTNIKFPETNVVACVFSYRCQSSVNYDTQAPSFDEYDRKVKRTGLKRYNYRVPDYLQGKLNIGDAVLVHCQTGYQLCEVVALNVITGFEEETLAPVVCKADMQPYFEEIEKEKQLKALQKKLVAEKKRLESLVTYELLAEKSPEFKELLDAFKALGGKV